MTLTTVLIITENGVIQEIHSDEKIKWIICDYDDDEFNPCKKPLETGETDPNYFEDSMETAIRLAKEAKAELP